MSEQMTSPPSPVVDQIPADLSLAKCIVDELIKAVQACGKSREISLAVTKLDESRMWMEEHQRRN